MQRDLLRDRVKQVLRFIAHVEVDFAIGTEGERVDAVIVIETADAGKEQLAFVSPTVPVRVGEHENVRGVGNDDFVSQHTNTECGVDARVLVKDGLFVRQAITICSLPE